MVFNEFFSESVLPFLLVFVVVFAILQKSQILGKDKRQIDALVALVIGLLVIGLPTPREFIVAFMPWLAVGIAVMLVFFILYGFVAGDLTSMPNPLKYTFGALAGIFVIGVLLYVTGFGTTIVGWFDSGTFDSDFWLTAMIVVLVIGALVWAVLGGGKGGDDKGKSKAGGHSHD